jgi:hypothetical protein
MAEQPQDLCWSVLYMQDKNVFNYESPTLVITVVAMIVRYFDLDYIDLHGYKASQVTRNLA